jgi:hypothetical protein
MSKISYAQIPEFMKFERDESAAVSSTMPSLERDCYLWWNNLSVSYEGGTRLLGLDGQPLRASYVKFHILDLKWQYSLDGPTSTITKATGTDQPAPGDFVFPRMAQFGILIFQDTWCGRVVDGDNEMSIQHPERDILFNVNDRKGTYGDNGGSFDLNLQIVR